MNYLSPSITDEELWNRVREGNQQSFEALYQRFFKTLYNYGRKMCSNTITVEDAIHDMFLDVWKYRSKISATTSVKFYLYCALRRKIIKNENKDINSSVFDFHVDQFFLRKVLPYEDDLILMESEDQRVNKLKRQMNNLPPRQYEAIVLRFYDDFSYAEIAQIMGVNEQSARNLVQRGLEQLRNFSKILLSSTMGLLALIGISL